jgi:hypothetical protein
MTARKLITLTVTLAIGLAGSFAAQAAASGSQTPQITATKGQLQFATARLAKLVVHADGPMTGYKRKNFGASWIDEDHNSCDTRDDILQRDFTTFELKQDERCHVASGVLKDPYTGTTITFDRAKPLTVQIDHVVALADAWRTGAADWTYNERVTYANDPQVLLAVDGPSNELKKDSDVGEWKPSNVAYDCMYVIRQVTIKSLYDLTVNAAEKKEMSAILASCTTK